MDNPHSPSPILASDYEAIEAAVMETEKGRWFLAEFARRNRSADTAEVLGAIARLEGVLRRERRPDVDRIRLDVAEMKDAIDRTKAEIAELRREGADGTRFARATTELDSIITQTEEATSEILGAAEKLQEMAFVMREGGINGEICDAVEALVMTIYTACSFQDLTGQRTQKVVQVLRFLESRINAMVEIWGLDGAEMAAVPPVAQPADARPDAHLLNGPAALGEGLAQDLVDHLMDEADIVEWSGDGGEEEAPAYSDVAAAEDEPKSELPPGLPEAATFLPDLTATDAEIFVPDAPFAPAAAPEAVATIEASPDALAWAGEVAVPPAEATSPPEGATADLMPALEPVLADLSSIASALEPVRFEPAASDDAGAAVDPTLAAAERAMAEAIEALREVTVSVSRPAPQEADPLDRLTRAERLALFS